MTDGKDGARSPHQQAWARITYPTAFRLSLDDFAAHAGWRIRRAHGEIWVSALERYESRRADLFRLVKLADVHTASLARSWEPLARLPRQDHLGSAEIRQAVAELREVRDPSSLEDLLVAFRLLFMTVPDGQLGTFVQQHFQRMLEAWPDATAWLVAFSESLIGRLSAARALFSADATPLNLTSPIDGLRLFPAGLSFMRSQLLGFPVYIEPSLLTLSPWVSGISSYRASGSVVVLFGAPILGQRAGVQAPELVDIFRAHSYATTERSEVPSLPSGSHSGEALEWWVGRVNDLFGVALDPSRYRDETGAFVPARQIGVLMSLERLFVSLETILSNPRDDFVRSVLMFDVLDALQGLGFDNWERMVTLRNVEANLAALEVGLPDDARAWLLPRCREAVDALGHAVDSFSPAYVEGDLVRLRSKSGADEQRVSRDRAYASLLHLTRNASHSYQSHAKDPHEVSLIASHDGQVPARLAFLALLHVLRLLVTPRLPTY